MTLQEQLLALQWSQLKHDETYHKDIVILPLAQRIKHMALHNAKYTAYFLEAVEGKNAVRFNQVLTDSFAIALASANTLNHDLGRELEGETPGTNSIAKLGARLGDSLPRDAEDPLWLVWNFIRHNGRLAKVCESWDHLEAVPFRDLMRACNVALLKTILAEASARDLDIALAYGTRMREVERRSIFDERYRAGAGGEA